MHRARSHHQCVCLFPPWVKSHARKRERESVGWNTSNWCTYTSTTDIIFSFFFKKSYATTRNARKVIGKMTEMENGWPAQTYRADSCYYSIEKKKKKPSLFSFLPSWDKEKEEEGIGRCCLSVSSWPLSGPTEFLPPLFRRSTSIWGLVKKNTTLMTLIEVVFTGTYKWGQRLYIWDWCEMREMDR